MKLRPISMDDLELYESIHCDPEMMEHLGGPWPEEGLSEKLRRDVASTEAGETWVFTIVPDEDDSTAAGAVSIWERSWKGERINEIGWMVLSRFQGQGVGSEAVRSVLESSIGRGMGRGPRVPPGHKPSIQRDVPEDGVLADRGVRVRVPGSRPPMQPLATRPSRRVARRACSAPCQVPADA